MGAYITAIHPDTGERVEFLGGGDSSNVYRVGDAVDWRINLDWVGHGLLLDDVYDARVVPDTIDQRPSTERAWVVVKDHVLTAILPIPDAESDPWARYDDIRSAFGIEEPDPSLWSDMALAIHHKRHSKSDRQWWGFIKSLFDRTPERDGSQDIRSGAA